MRQQFGRLALFASASLALAACSTTRDAAPAYPIVAPAETPPPPPFTPEPIPTDPAPSAAPTESVTSQPLPPTSPAPSSAPMPQEPPIPQPPPYQPPPPPAPPVVVMSVTGRVVDAEGPPRVHTVRRGDTIDAIARDFGITRKQLTDANDIAAPFLIKPGDRLTGPRSRAKAYIVGQGDTMYAISRRFNVTAAALAEANDLSLNDTIRSGQRLILPAGYKDDGPTRRTVAAPAPARCGSWAEKIRMARAFTKPVRTELETKRISTPMRSNPNTTCTRPARMPAASR